MSSQWKKHLKQEQQAEVKSICLRAKQFTNRLIVRISLLLRLRKDFVWFRYPQATENILLTLSRDQRN